MSNATRRAFLSGLAGAGAWTWLALDPERLRAIGHYVASMPAQEPLEFLTAEQAREFDAIFAQIVPSDDTPGAREARVVRFMDRWWKTAPEEAHPRIRELLQAEFTVIGDRVAERSSGSRSFAALGDVDQIAVLTALERSHPEIFNRCRARTMLGLFSHPMHGGNAEQIGWKLIGFEDRYSWVPPFGDYDRA